MPRSCASAGGHGARLKGGHPPTVLALQFLDNCERALILNTPGQINT